VNNVLIMPGSGKRDANAILETAKNADLESVVVIGWTAGGEFFVSHSHDSPAELLWDIKVAEQAVLAPD